MFILTSQFPALDTGDPRGIRSKAGSTQPEVPLSVTVPPHASQGPSETLICPPAKPFSLHCLLLGYMVKSPPSSNHQTNKSSLDLMPYLSSVLLSQTPQPCPHCLHLLTEKTSSRPRSLRPGHTGGLHLPASLAVSCGHIHSFWPRGCEWKRASHLIPVSPTPPYVL